MVGTRGTRPSAALASLGVETVDRARGFHLFSFVGSSERVIGTKRRLSRRAKEGRDEGGIIPDGQKRQECGRRSLERKKRI